MRSQFNIPIAEIKHKEKFDVKIFYKNLKSYSSTEQIKWLQLYQKQNVFTSDNREFLMKQAIQDNHIELIKVLHIQGIEPYSYKYLTHHVLNTSKLFLHLNQDKLDDALKFLHQSKVNAAIHVSMSEDKISFKFNFSDIDIFLHSVKKKT